ncbi:MAG: glycosyltransferase [Flavobacteriaceae bacterium]|nr:glycosyltransferase [Flavobacteriaceae bacterium]
MKTKIAILMNDFSTWGGVEIVSNQLIRSDIPFWSIVSLKRDNEKLSLNFPSHIALYTINDDDKIVHLLKENKTTHVIIQIFDLKRSYILIQKFKKEGIKTIFFFHNTPFIYCENFKHNKSLKERVFELIRNIIKSTTYRFTKSRFEKVISACDVFLALSENIVEEFKTIVRKDLHSKIEYMYNLIPLEMSRKPFQEKKNSIVFAGRLMSYKGAKIAVKTLAPLLKKHSDWDFYILGDGKEYEEIKEFLQKNGIKNIHLKGKVDNVYEYLAESKICLLYSLFEGLPTILLEAGFFKNVLISYNSRGGVSDIVKNNENGFIVKSEKELYKKIEFLINNPHKMEEMSEKNQEIFKKFNRESLIEKWHKILRR